MLLHEVYALLEDYPDQFIFAPTGSSARKLRRSEANFLAGRSLTHQFFPFRNRKRKANTPLKRYFNMEVSQKYLGSSQLKKNKTT